MNDLDVSARPRRVVLDVMQRGSNEQQNSQNQHNNRHRRKKKKKQPFDAYARDPHVGHLTPHDVDMLKGEPIDPVEHVPMELRRLIEEALAYGRKTHALGVMNAAKALSNIASKIRSRSAFCSGEELREMVWDIVKEAEEESKKILATLEVAYNEDQEASA